MAFSIVKFVSRFPNLIDIAIKIPIVHRHLNRYLINKYANSAPARPRQLSLRADHTSWASLTDKTYTARHLPPNPTPQILPDIALIEDLWRRADGQEILSKDTSLLFAFFAQWFTDSFLRTDNDDPKRNNSNHEIDFCQLYGQTVLQTDILRSKVNGKLQSQLIDGQEYPPYLFDPDLTKPDQLVFSEPKFARLHAPKNLARNMQGFRPEHAKYMFATGLEHGNTQIGYTVLSVIFLREHNRICDELAASYPAWDDERLFDTARAIMTVLLLNIILGEYVAQVGIVKFPFKAEPGWPETQKWYRSNWINLEFSLLYRWHSMVPDAFVVDGKQLTSDDYRRNPALIHQLGVAAIVAGASSQTAGKIGMGNTHDIFFEKMGVKGRSIQGATLAIARQFGLQSMNSYRKYFGLDPIRKIEDFVDDPVLAKRLAQLYDHPDDIEWIVGVFAEKHGAREMMGDLMVRMVAHDAFTHALTNPLLSQHIYGPETFSDQGLEIINQTKSLRDIVARNVADPSKVVASFQSWKPVPGARKFAWVAWIIETADFLFVGGWQGHFNRRKSQLSSTVFRNHALRSSTVILDVIGCEVFTHWDGRLVKEPRFGPASVPQSLTGHVTPTVFENGDRHAAYKTVYAQIIAARQPMLASTFKRVFARHAAQWTAAERINFAPSIEPLCMDFLFEWLFDIAVPASDLTKVYNGIFGHMPRKFARLNPFSKLHKSQRILSDLKPQIMAAPLFKEWAGFAQKAGIPDADELAEQLMFMIGMNGYLGLQSLFKSLVGEMSQTLQQTDDLRAAFSKDGLRAAAPFVAETLRLHPPVFFVYGVAAKAFMLKSSSGHFPIAKGEQLMGVVPFVQRDPVIFKNPEAFDPTRKSTDASQAAMIWSHSRQDDPVTQDDHGCVGKDVALQCAALFLQGLVTDYDWRLVRPASWPKRGYPLNIAAPKGQLETRYFKRAATSADNDPIS